MTIKLDKNQVMRELAPDGVLSVAFNLSNSLLVSVQAESGALGGVAPDLAVALADLLGVRLQHVAFKTPGEIAGSADAGTWSVAMIGADPARAASIRFTDPYASIEAGYLVPPGSRLTHASEVDRPGVRIAAYQGSAYDLWLSANLKHATVVHGGTFDEAFTEFRTKGLDALASLMPKLLEDEESWPGTRILDGSFMQVRQAIGTQRRHRAAAAFLQAFVDSAKQEQLVERLIQRHAVRGLTAVQVTDMLPRSST